MSEAARSLQELLLEHAAAGPVLSKAMPSLEQPGGPAFRAAYAGAARRLGVAASAPFPSVRTQFYEVRSHWTLLDAVRLSLTTSALARLGGEQGPNLVLTLFEAGEIGEQESLLRTLSALPNAEHFLDTARLACRTNAGRVFEAIAAENTYPVRYFDEPGFNQLVLKAIFIEVPVQRIEGLERRITPELVRMVRGYASERRAAGRSIPEAVQFIVTHAREERSP